MARYQLFRTSPSLSGQVRLDILVNKDPETQIIQGNDIHLSPISDKIIYNESNARNTLRYSHLENIKNLYREIGPQFYSTEGEYTNNIWLYDVDGFSMDPYSHCYMMGPRRMRFSRYDKQFSYFMPLWISEETDFSKMSFRFHASNEGQDIILSSFKLSPEICKYLQDYMDHTSTGSVISDNLINIDFETNTSYIQGVQADTGLYETRDTSYIMEFLLKRERPMLETDYNILDLFRQNLMIAQQLLNLNLVFNLRDVSGSWPEYMLYNKKVKFWVDVLYDNKSLSIKDLYTNYQFVPKYNISTMNPSKSNCLDFMKDNLCLDIILDNKFVQSTFHWALKEDSEYLFNLYSGCSPVIGKDPFSGELMELKGGNFNWVDISLAEADPWQQNWHWAKCWKITGENWINNYNDAIDDARNGDFTSVNKLFTKISKTDTSISIGNNIFYKYKNDNDRDDYKNILDQWDGDIYIALIINPEVNGEIYNINHDQMISDSDGKNHYIVIECINENAAVLHSLCHMPELYSDFWINPVVLDILWFFLYMTGYNQSLSKSGFNLWDRWKKPSKIEFTKILDIYNTGIELFDQRTKEIRYSESDDLYYSYMYRYSGKLVPFFIDIDLDDSSDLDYKNNYYYYFQWDDANIDIIKRYAELINLKMTLSYPSIEMKDGIKCFPWIEKQDIQDAYQFYEGWPEDIIWNRKSALWNLPITVKFQINLKRGASDEEIKEGIWEGFKEAIKDQQSDSLYDIISMNEKQMRFYIEKQYNIEQQFEYAAIDNINDIIYTVSYKLR